MATTGSALPPEHLQLLGQIVEKYYNQFDNDRSGITFYTPESTLTFESATFVGRDAILEKLKNLPFTRLQHVVETLDAQLNAATNTYMVLVTGRLLVDEEQNRMTFTQFFLIAPNPHTSEPNFAARNEEEIYIHSDIFKLIFP
ncbi:nuclear transport factor 2 domain-containing protein [Camillea tinctor]|nr:nuclear transport factor 2 domain-containing protein [Camillea tinctor]